MVEIDSCYECESIYIDYRFLTEEDNYILYEAVCRTCGTIWTEEDEK